MEGREVSVNSTADFVVVERSSRSGGNERSRDGCVPARLPPCGNCERRRRRRKGQCFSTRGKSTVVGGAVRAAREASTTRELSARFTPVIART